MTQRDVDLLTLEQLHVSPTFVAWIGERAGIAGARLASARHCVYADRGETDVLAIFEEANGRVALMIEDKIGAPMQPRQAERYHERGQALCAAGKASRYRTMLCAPKAYLDGVPEADGWQARVSLKDLAAWIEQEPSPAAA